MQQFPGQQDLARRMQCKHRLSLLLLKLCQLHHQRFQVQAYPFLPAIAGALNGMWLLTHNMLCTLTAACHRICSCCVSRGQGRTVERVLRTRCQTRRATWKDHRQSAPGYPACHQQAEETVVTCTLVNLHPGPVDGAYVKKRTSQVSWARNSGRWHVRRYFPKSVPHTASVR